MKLFKVEAHHSGGFPVQAHSISITVLANSLEHMHERIKPHIEGGYKVIDIQEIKDGLDVEHHEFDF